MHFHVFLVGGGTGRWLTAAVEPVPEDFERALFVAAHPDDLEYGLAGVAARWTGQHKQVVYVLATAGEAGIDTVAPQEAGPLREQEERDGAAEVGVEVVEFLGHADGTLEPTVALRRDLARSIRRHRPEVVVTMTWAERPGWGGLNHADHRATGIAALDAVRDAGNRWVFPELRDEGLEPWSGVRFALVHGAPEPTRSVDVTGHLDAAVRSLEAHRVYLDVLGGDVDPRAFLARTYAAGGEAVGVEHAVTLELIELG